MNQEEIFPLRLFSYIQRALEKKKTFINIVGTQSTLALSELLFANSVNSFNELPQAVVVSSLKEAEQLKEQLAFFSGDIRCFIFPGFDASPYSGLYPSLGSSWQRSRFLYWARRAHEAALSKGTVITPQKNVFIFPITGLLQKTTPFSVFSQACLQYTVGDSLPTNLSSFLQGLGYQAAPMVEDRGQFCIRGGIVDLFSPAEDFPTRLSLFGDDIESIKFFSAETQLSFDTEKTPNLNTTSLHLCPIYETVITDNNVERVLDAFLKAPTPPGLKHEKEDLVRAISQKLYQPGCEFLLPLLHERLACVLDYFSSAVNLFYLDPSEISRVADQSLQELKADLAGTETSLFRLPIDSYFYLHETLPPPPEDSLLFHLTNLSFLETAKPHEERLDYITSSIQEFSKISTSHVPGTTEWKKAIQSKLAGWLSADFKILISVKSQSHLDRLKVLLAATDITFNLIDSVEEFLTPLQRPSVFLVLKECFETLLIQDERQIFLRDDDFFGKKHRAPTTKISNYEEFAKKAKSLSFADLQPQDLVVHVKHGVGVYEGLKVMSLAGVESEFIQVGYKDKDKLYLPVYRVGQLQKYSGPNQSALLDKLGGVGWEKTKIKVKAHLKDIAAELLQLYARRAEIQRPALPLDPVLYGQFEQSFPFNETQDQLRAINEIQQDFKRPQPMDRLVCGDVGFGKTEVCMRAAFQAVMAGKQVAVLAPTTVLTFQHLETFKKRFTHHNLNIKSLNRFVLPAEQKRTLADLKEGKVNIVIGTHRILSKDVVFQNLGLLIVDEEHKFGVTHKEKIKKLRVAVDTLTLSATPIPRTLNMSFSGLRDLSIINTAPVDRLPTRTFVAKFDPELVKKAIAAEINRGGQVYFIHNRIQSIYSLADELRQILPQARMRVAHGQMPEHELEEAMLAFFNHEIDVLICTAIVESGMDVPRANTMFIDQAHMFGLSQLYQLRGRVGRSKTRAYCYLILPKDKKIDRDAQERLKIIQDNSSLGSGIKIAQYDLELRGAGNILGDDQSGHINSVGYELYMDLLNQAIAEAKGEPINDVDLDPEINLRIPALIPDSYIADIRLRLNYYKALAEINSQEDLDKIETELHDQFGAPPEPVINLMGLMLIRRQCKDLGVRDISAGPKNISLVFTEKTKLSPEKAIQLASRENKKYSLTPDQRLNVRMNNISWSGVYDELNYLLSLI